MRHLPELGSNLFDAIKWIAITIGAVWIAGYIWGGCL